MTPDFPQDEKVFWTRGLRERHAARLQVLLLQAIAGAQERKTGPDPTEDEGDQGRIGGCAEHVKAVAEVRLHEGQEFLPPGGPKTVRTFYIRHNEAS
jgi:hypothetical protein